MRQARWGRVMWRFFRAWGLASITGKIPVVVWDGASLVALMAECPLCGGRGVGLRHILGECKTNEDLRQGLPEVRGVEFLRWVLVGGTSDMGILTKKTKYVGLCVARLAHCMAGLKRNDEDERMSSAEGSQPHRARESRGLRESGRLARGSA